MQPKIQFRKDGTLKILQVSDAQDMHIVRPEMVRMLNAVYESEKPDLVVFTGDNILGNHVDDSLVGSSHPKRSKAFTKRRIIQSLRHILEPLEIRGIPFTMTYGNHDDKNALTQREQAQLWQEYNGFLGLSDDPDVPCDTFCVPIYDSTGEKQIYNLYMMDSAGTDSDGKGYEGVGADSLSWYRKKSAELREKNGGNPMPSLMFQHIPFPESAELFELCSAEDEGAFFGYDRRYYRLNPAKATGFAYEYAFLEKDNGQLSALSEMGDVDAVVSGHLHLNGYDGTVQGQRVIATPGASFRSYGLPQTRGVRVFNLREDNPSDFETHVLTYYDIFPKNMENQTRYFFNGDEMEVKRNIAVGTAAVGAVALGATALILKGLKKK